MRTSKLTITLVHTFIRDQYEPEGVDCRLYQYILPNGHVIKGDRVDRVSFRQAFEKGLFLIDRYKSEEKKWQQTL